MCIFSGEVTHVARTRIFARFAGKRQRLVYEMRVAAAEPVAMILPLPVAAGAGEGDVRFPALDWCPDFFDRMERLFPAPPSYGTLGFGVGAQLEVHRVGAFVASFVPTVADFDRLDPRFRLPAGAIDARPEYDDWGFAVFQLAEVADESTPIHPMAVTFPARQTDALFFPTVHVHDGTAPTEAAFDHVLFAQGVRFDLFAQESASPVGDTFGAHGAGNLVDRDARVARLRIAGMHPNRDTWIPVAP